MNIYIGTSGWHYKHWRGNFYPAEYGPKRWFSFYARHFRAVEINSSFYRLPSDKAVRHWDSQAPNGFFYSIKASRSITHSKKLRESEEILDRFLNAVRPLQTKTAVILFQLPPNFRVDEVRLEKFLRILAVKTEKPCVFEFRSDSWFVPAVRNLLCKYNQSFCIWHAGGEASPIWNTGPVSYVRLHGEGGFYWGSYSHRSLGLWGERLRQWARARDTFLFFDNDAEGAAPRDALWLKSHLGID